jgi:hypothetical protein
LNEASPTCSLSLAANALASFGEPWNVEGFDVFQHESGRFVIVATVSVVKSYWPFDPDQCEHKGMVAGSRVGNYVFCATCSRHVPAQLCEALA